MSDEEWLVVGDILAEADRLYRALERSAMAGRRRSTGSGDETSVAIDRFRRSSLARLADERRPLVRDALLIVQLCGADEEALGEIDRQQIRAEVAPESPVWAAAVRDVHPAILYAIGIDDAEGTKYLSEIRRRHTDPDLRAMLIIEEVDFALDARRYDECELLLVELEQIGVHESQLDQIREMVRQVSSLAPGVAAPDFDLRALDDPERRHRLSSFAGTHLLLHFWSSWCEPCLDDLGRLHELHEHYGEKLAILSLSEDESIADVRDFRAEPGHEMPWEHAFLGVGGPGETSDRYGVRFLPRLVLIGPDGNIVVEQTSELRGDRLNQTLEQQLEGI